MCETWCQRAEPLVPPCQIRTICVTANRSELTMLAGQALERLWVDPERELFALTVPRVIAPQLACAHYSYDTLALQP